jgi:hypothetical protein
MADLTWNDLANSKYMNAGDVSGKRIPGTIKKIVMEKMNDGAEKPVVYFDEFSKGVVLNATRRKFLASLCKSTKVSDAIGRRIDLVEGMTQFQGEDRATIKFAMPKEAVKQQIANELNDALPDFG